LIEAANVHEAIKAVDEPSHRSNGQRPQRNIPKVEHSQCKNGFMALPAKLAMT
jgi:hypothetical protein